LYSIQNGGMDLFKVNIIGAGISVITLSLCCFIFAFRLLGYPKVEYWLGIILILTIIPMVFLLMTAKQFQRPPLFYIQIAWMITFLVVELFFDYIFKLEFRNVTWITIIYLALFYGGTGGMIGIAMHAGRSWMITAVILFLVMTTLSLVQRAITGM